MSETDDSSGDSTRMRLNRFLAAAGFGSRRKVEEHIEAGRVSVNGRVAQNLWQTVGHDDVVRFDDQRIVPQKKRYFLVNKPSGYVCTHRDPNGKPRAIDLVPGDSEQLFPVGRLDETSEGLLLITNDGELAQRLAHPRFQVPRKYKAQVVGEPNGETLQMLRKGLHFSEGRFHVDFVKKVKTQGKSSWLELELRQGRNREIRRLLARVDHKVISLHRISFGPLRLGKLKPGKYRSLTQQEVDDLRAMLDSGKRGSGHRRARKVARKKTSDANPPARTGKFPRRGKTAARKPKRAQASRRRRSR